jgi:AraC-like DNA-binding protein
MLLRDFLPHPLLREFIQWYRICHFEFGKSEVIPVKSAVPKPENILHFFLRDYWAIQRSYENIYVQPSVVFVGQRTFLVQQHTGYNFLNIQIVFQPTGVFRLTGIPANILSNEHVDGTIIFPKGIPTTLERLQNARGYTEMLAVIEEFSFALVRQSCKNKNSLDIVSQRLIQQGGNVSLDELADDACLSTKQFKRKFYESIGVNPKTYARITRLTKAYNLKNAYPERDWLSIAIECGFCDYQHLVKDYKDFTGTTPNEFLALEGRTPERVLKLTDHLYQERAMPFISK